MIRFHPIAALRAGVSFALLSTVLPALGAEAIGVLPDTGQTGCFDLEYNAVPCEEATTGDSSALPRQDARFGRDAAAAMGRLPKVGGGEYGFDYTRICMNGNAEGTGSCPLNPPVPADVEHPSPNDWACLRDNVTGLLWSLGNLAITSWAEASSTEDGSYIHRANTSARCGRSDGWRLPARREGLSLMSAGRNRPNVEPAYFPVLSTAYQENYSFWTTDVDAWGHSGMNHVLEFAGFGTLLYQCRDVIPGDPWCGTPPPGTNGRWPARVLLVNGTWRSASQIPNEPRWRIREDGLVVTDTATGLMWDRCTWGQTGPGCEGEGQIFHYWNEGMRAPSAANQMRYKGYYDWRLPNVRELESIVKVGASSPAIDTTIFPNTPSTMYWSATQVPVIPTVSNTARCVIFREGGATNCIKHVDVGLTPDRSPVRLVRGGHQYGAFDGIGERLFLADFDDAPAF